MIILFTKRYYQNLCINTSHYLTVYMISQFGKMQADKKLVRKTVLPIAISTFFHPSVLVNIKKTTKESILPA